MAWYNLTARLYHKLKSRNIKSWPNNLQNSTLTKIFEHLNPRHFCQNLILRLVVARLCRSMSDPGISLFRVAHPCWVVDQSRVAWTWAVVLDTNHRKCVVKNVVPNVSWLLRSSYSFVFKLKFSQFHNLYLTCINIFSFVIILFGPMLFFKFGFQVIIWMFKSITNLHQMQNKSEFQWRRLQ